MGQWYSDGLLIRFLVRDLQVRFLLWALHFHSAFSEQDWARGVAGNRGSLHDQPPSISIANIITQAELKMRNIKFKLTFCLSS